MSEQSTALRLADELELNKWRTLDELRRLRSENERLHALNGELLEALKQIVNSADNQQAAILTHLLTTARAAIARAEGT
jgi:hypothetical protein